MPEAADKIAHWKARVKAQTRHIAELRASGRNTEAAERALAEMQATINALLVGR